jgi:hypothetical protein
MPSELKSETSRANGAKSNGPTTAAGKEASSRNSFKHGFTARNTYILDCESPEEFKEFWAEHIAIHQPVTAPERELVEQMAIARWRIRRFVGAETVLIDCEMVRNREKVDKEFATLNSGVHIALAIKSLADESRCLSLMSRYESRTQRAHDKAYAAFLALHSPSVSAGAAPPDPGSTPPEPAPTTPTATQSTAPTPHNPSVSAGASEISPNEPSAPPSTSPDIHLVTPVPAAETGNSEDHDG